MRAPRASARRPRPARPRAWRQYQHVVFVRELLLDLAIRVSAPDVIYSDSKSAVGMAFDPVAFKKTKHIHPSYVPLSSCVTLSRARLLCCSMYPAL